MHDIIEMINASNHAERKPRKRKCAVMISIKPISITNKLEASKEETGIYSFKIFTREAIGGVRTEMILMTPNRNIITGGSNLRNRSFPLRAKERTPAIKGNQNSKILKIKVMASAFTNGKL